jgi:predicted transcriptional regulator
MKEQSQNRQSQEKGTFGVYLDLLRGGGGRPRTQEDNLMELLNQLADEEEKPLAKMATDCEMPMGEFANSLETLQSLDMISVQEEAGTKVVRLTSNGADYISTRRKS